LPEVVSVPLKVLWLAQTGRCLARELSYKVGELGRHAWLGTHDIFAPLLSKGKCFTYIFMQLAIASSVGSTCE
jgi:hypothetical protein